MFVTSYRKVKESIDLHENSTTSAFVSQRSVNKLAFSSDFFQRDEQVEDKKRIYWEKRWEDGMSIPFDGIPFMVVGREDFECHQGPNHKTQAFKNTQDEDHSYIQKKRKRIIKNTKKMDCLAAIKVKVVVKFPQFKVEGVQSEWKLREIAKRIKIKENLEKESRFYIFFPTDGQHKNHLTGELAGFCQPPSEKVRRKIKDLAMLGIRKVSDVNVFLENYVSNELLPGVMVSKHNRRYFPAKKNIRNYIYSALKMTRFSSGDQQGLKNLISDFQQSRHEDNFFIRTMEEEQSDEEDRCDDSDEVLCPRGFLFIHQTNWQKRLLLLYGQELCLLDATYKTTKYDLPLFFICVQTNIGFAICATFITANESKDCIAEALQIIKDWNPDWHPSHFFTDFDEREITAVEEIFQGCTVYLCLFHREQAWDRWLRETKHGVSNNICEVKLTLRKVANSATEEDFNMHLDELQNSGFYKENSKLKKWLDKKWLPNRNRWVFAYRKHLVNIRLTTTNGLERKHQDFKKNYLKHYGDGTLITMVTVLIERFLKESYDQYIEYNIKSLEMCKQYHVTVPKYLQNKPKLFVQHCMERLPPNCTLIPGDSITSEGSDVYSVRSVDSDGIYKVCLNEVGPYCECMDWGKNHWPCKHMLAVFGSIDGWQWDFLPVPYRDCPHFNLDPTVIAAAASEIVDVVNIQTMPMPTEGYQDNAESESFNVSEIHVEPIISQQTNVNHSFGNYITRCTHVIKDIQSNLYGINSEESFNEVLADLQALYAKTKDMLPLDEGLPLRKEPPPPSAKKSTKLMKRNLPLRKKRTTKLALKKQKRPTVENVVVDGTYDCFAPLSEENGEIPTPEIRDYQKERNGVNIQEDMEGSSVYPVQSKRGNKQRGQGTSKRLKKAHVKKTKQLDPVEQALRFEQSVDVGNMTVDVHGYRMSRQSFLDLDGMLPDEVINAYMSLKCKECENKQVHFLSSEVMTSIFCGFLDPNDPFPVHTFLADIDIEGYDILIGAINEAGCHWTLMVIYPKHLQLLYVNPLGEAADRKDIYLQKWLVFLNTRYNQGIGTSIPENWTMVAKRHRKQLDSSSCGIFVLKLAELILKDQANLVFDTSVKGLQTLRMEIGQYLVESSINMQEVSVTQEVTGGGSSVTEEVTGGGSSVDEDEDDEYPDDNNPDKLSVKTCESKYRELQDRLHELISCEKEKCEQSSHYRHHEFISNPLGVYNRERLTHNFGGDIMTQRATEYIGNELRKDFLIHVNDPRHPYTKRWDSLRNLSNRHLENRFKCYKLAPHYIQAVLLKEVINFIYMETCGKTYSQSDEICQQSEVNITVELRKCRQNKELLDKM